ncbi:MAG: dTDP-glucose 4,6-dehydratase [Patescibacteria group bacterium]
MKLVVTGGCGFIGTNFIHYILNKYPDYSVINIDKITYAGHPENLEIWENNPRYKLVLMDINDEKVENFIKECDTIVHFAAESHVDNSILSADEFIKTNVNGTYNLLKYALKYKKRFHHISTDEVFGSLPLDSKKKFNETTRYNPRNPYSASKASADHLVRCYFETYGLPVTISNCSNNYGPYQNKGSFLPKVILNILSGQKVPVYGDGLNVRDWIFVEDHCSAIDLIIHNGVIGETYCIGGLLADYNNLTILNMVADILKQDSIQNLFEFVPDRIGHDRRYAVDWSKIHRELGWKPKCNFEESLIKTVNWYKQKFNLEK